MPNLLAVSEMTPQILTSVQLDEGDNTVYTAPIGGTAKIAQGVLCNVSDATVNVSVDVVPAGGLVDGSHTVISAFPLAAGDSLSLADYLAGAMLGPGDFISVNASAADAVNLLLTGVACS